MVVVALLFSQVACAEFAQVVDSKPHASQSAGIPKGKYYVVKSGDTLYGIAAKFRVNVLQLREANNLDEGVEINPGQRLLIPKTEKARAQKVEKPRKSPVKDSTQRSTGPQKSGKKAEPKTTPKRHSTAVQVNNQVKRNNFEWPMDGIVTSLFGKRRGRDHDGIDISAPFGTPVKAAESGRVIYIGRFRGYGNLVIVKHLVNYFSAYAHLSAIKVAKDQKVHLGDVVGNVGRSGRSSGSHLHFEIRYQTVAKDPLIYLPKDGRKIREAKDGNPE